MPLHIKDDTTALHVAQLAKLRGIFKQDAVEISRASEVGPGGGGNSATGTFRPAPGRSSTPAPHGRGGGQGALRRAIRRAVTIFVDASALIAIIAGEADADALADVLEADRTRLCSAMSVWETVAGLCRPHACAVPDARAHVRAFLDAARFQFIVIGEREADLATDAYARFGEGRHPAALNMGDCFAYACAKANDAALLYKGDDFATTDLRQVLFGT